MHKLQLRGSSFFLPGLEPVGLIKNIKEVFQLNWPVKKNEGLLYSYFVDCEQSLIFLYKVTAR